MKRKITEAVLYVGKVEKVFCLGDVVPTTGITIIWQKRKIRTAVSGELFFCFRKIVTGKVHPAVEKN